MEIVPKKIECDVVTVRDIEPGELFKVVNDDKHMYVKASINDSKYDAMCLNDGSLYKNLVADVVKINGTFVENHDKIIEDKNYRIIRIANENHELKKQIEQLQAELDAVKKSEQEYKDTLIKILNMESNEQAEEIHKLEQEIDELNDELKETKNILEHTRNIQRQTAETNDKLREYLSEKDKIINSFRTELKNLQAALNFKSDDEELTVVATAKAVERIKQLERDNEALMFQLQKEQETSDTTNNAVIEQQAVQLQDTYRLLEQIANIVYTNGFHCCGQAILNNPERLLSKLKKLMETTDTTKSRYTLSDSKIDEMKKKLFTSGLNLDFKDRNDVVIAEELADKLIEVQQSYTDYIGKHVAKKIDTDNQRLTTATKERILKDMTEAGITDFKPINDSVDALVSELTYAYIADHVACRKILEQCRAFSDAVLKYEEPVLDYSDIDEENDDFDEPTD